MRPHPRGWNHNHISSAFRCGQTAYQREGTFNGGVRVGVTWRRDSRSRLTRLERALSNGLTGLPEQSSNHSVTSWTWKREAVNIALKDKGTLRQGISVEVEGDAGTFGGLIKSIAIEESGGKWGAFNYAYYWHEYKKEVQNPTTAGTVAQYLNSRRMTICPLGNPETRMK